MVKHAFLILSVLLTGCFLLGPDAGLVSTRIGHEVRDKNEQHIDMTEMTDFPWDELYLFGPYQARDSICRTLQIGGTECSRVSPEMVDEGDVLLVFRNRGDIAHVEKHRRYLGDFSSADKSDPIRREDAKFIVEQSSVAADGKPWLKLNLLQRSNPPKRTSPNGEGPIDRH
ncbi:hypothetical protein [Noviherbaspirillum sp.]|jgi:hypothetical protein|uniref:hypothetical protein n=1 Tax=Noviherbaspirillum sp. TaxID=1926288 RepID=UPI0025E8619E|nr:hypothetical protein [Noviherbaspirillum sp.]